MYVQDATIESNPRLRALFAEPVVDLGADDVRYRGIVTPRAEHHAEKRGVTSQFLEHAAEYDRRYANVEHFRTLIDNALAVLRPPIAPRTILDIGSGSGNSVIPLLDRFKDAFVVATDISPQLLAILRDYLEARPEYRGRYALVCMDACNDRYRASVFDLAVGAAILHHVIEPERVVRACESDARAGWGRYILRALCRSATSCSGLPTTTSRRRPFGAAKIRGDSPLLREISGDYAARARDESDPAFLALDDKWMFTRRFFESFYHRGEWAECHVIPIHGHATPLTDQTRNSLALAGIELPSCRPGPGRRLRASRPRFRRQARAELMLECAVILRTASRRTDRPAGGVGLVVESGRVGAGLFLRAPRRPHATRLLRLR